MNEIKKNINCTFCETLKKQKEDREYFRRDSDKSVTKYTAALVEGSYIDDWQIGQFTHYGFGLNFCPVCGRTLMENPHKENLKSISFPMRHKK